MRALLIFAVAVCCAAVAPARAEERSALTAAYLYAPPAITIDAGDELLLTNLDRDAHTLTARVQTPDGVPLFDTPPSGARLLETVPVDRVAALPPGDYAFFCTFHPAVPTMAGVLHVR